ncbi:MAG: hypothetical protein ACLQVI_02675 [Polyangiaceae bacterium]
MQRRHRRFLAAALVAIAACAWGGCAQIFGIDSPNSVPEPGDGGDGGDSTVASDGATTDSTATTDVTVSDAPFVDTSSPAPPDDANDGETAEDACTAILARMLNSAIVPPTRWAGIDLSNGGSSDVPGGGGITLVQAEVAACAAWSEPTTLAPDAAPLNGGYRAALFGIDDAGPNLALAGGVPIWIESNMQTGAVWKVSLQQGYAGTLSFNSRAGGAYGTHTYEMQIGRAITRDGEPFKADWGDGGTLTTATPWMNEIYDGMMATFSPTTPAITDCLSTTLDGYWQDSVQQHYSACLIAGNYYFGVRPLAAYFDFNPGTNKVIQMWTFWWGSVVSCGTPIANTEAMDYGGIGVGEVQGGNWIGATNALSANLGNLVQTEYASNPLGLTATEANEIECNGTPVSAPDPGYGALEWGQLGEVEMEYVLDGGVNYRLYAHAGYKGLLQWSAAGDNFSTGIGVPVTRNGSEDAGSPNALATSLTNGVCSFSDTDCVDAGHCTVILNDGSGNTYLGVSCGYPADLLGIEFPQGTNTPTEIFTTNPNLE